MPFKGFCIECNKDFEADTKEAFGDLLIEHHQSRGKDGRSIIANRCNVFQCEELDENGNVLEHFGLDATMEIVARSWSGELWYQKPHGTERE